MASVMGTCFPLFGPIGARILGAQIVRDFVHNGGARYPSADAFAA